MPTGAHEGSIADVEGAIYTQLKLIRDGLDRAALFGVQPIPPRSIS
jgi:hypothetical protein